jgi:ADP-heptose:LPS heptosyltransferase
MKPNLIINQNCRHFRGDRPCLYHKRYGSYCEDCEYYSPVGKRILIIKLAAVGDVLRSTGLLEAMKKKCPDSHITWITEPAAFPLFENNGLVDTLLEARSCFTLLTLNANRYDVLFSLETNQEGTMLASQASAEEKYGYVYSRKGRIFPLSKAAEYWYMMGVSDEIKKANRRTYQQIMFEICGLDPSVSARPVIATCAYENRITANFRAASGISDGDTVIGLNTGAGARWPLKRWNIAGFVRLVERLLEYRNDLKIVLYGGPEEREINRKILEEVPDGIIDSGCDNSLREFIALIDACNILVTGDTLAMHIAIALNKYLLVLMGPTSAHEIDLFGRGKKIISDLDCLCCYRNTCDKTVNCMNSISDENVFNHIVKRLEKRD